MVRKKENINPDIEQQKKIAEENAKLAAGGDAAGNYPGKVNVPYTIGAKSAVPGTIPEGQTQATFKDEAEYQKLATEKRKGLQEQALLLNQQLTNNGNAQGVQGTQGAGNINSIIQGDNKTNAENFVNTQLLNAQQQDIQEIQQRRETGKIAAGIGATSRREMLAAQLQTAKGIGKQTTNIVANAYDAVTRLISPLFSGGRMRQSAVVTQSQETFNNVKSLLEADIADVQAGFPSSTAEEDMQEALAAVNRLESYTHRAGIIDLNRWLDNGKELETQIKENKRILINLAIKLEQAKNQNQLNNLASLRQGAYNG